MPARPSAVDACEAYPRGGALQGTECPREFRACVDLRSDARLRGKRNQLGNRWLLRARFRSRRRKFFHPLPGRSVRFFFFHKLDKTKAFPWPSKQMGRILCARENAKSAWCYAMMTLF